MIEKVVRIQTTFFTLPIETGSHPDPAKCGPSNSSPGQGLMPTFNGVIYNFTNDTSIDWGR